MLKMMLLFQKGPARDGAAAFFGSIGASVPTLPPIPPQRPAQPASTASGVVPLDPPRRQSRKKVAPSHAGVTSGGHRCVGFHGACDNDGGPNGGLCAKCRKRKQRFNDKKYGVKR